MWVFVVLPNKTFNLMLVYLLHMIIRARRNKGAAGRVLQDHMPVVCGGIWAVVSFSFPLFGIKRVGEGGEPQAYTQNIPLFKTHTLPQTCKHTKAHYQCHYSSTQDQEIFQIIFGVQNTYFTNGEVLPQVHI